MMEKHDDDWYYGPRRNNFPKPQLTKVEVRERPEKFRDMEGKIEDWKSGPRERDIKPLTYSKAEGQPRVVYPPMCEQWEKHEDDYWDGPRKTEFGASLERKPIVKRIKPTSKVEFY